jgi:hypothetical protein
MIFGCTSSVAELEPFEPDHADTATRAPVRGRRAEGAEPDDAEVVPIVGTAQRGTPTSPRRSYTVMSVPPYRQQVVRHRALLRRCTLERPGTCIVRGSIGSGESVSSKRRGRSSAGRAPALQAGRTTRCVMQ